jgi:transcriptional regulator with XRE-family HTH domain
VEDLQVGAVIRAVRRRRGLRQSDLAELADVDQAVVSLLERGHLGDFRLKTIRAVCAALEISLPLAPRWQGSDLARLLDREHAALVDQTVALLKAEGWETLLE